MEGLVRKSDENKHLPRRLSLLITVMIFMISLTGCTPSKECVDIRLKMEEDGYLDGWTYVKNIEKLNGEDDLQGRILFALYENEEKPGEYAVLEVGKLTVPDSYNGRFVGVSYNSKSNTAESLDDGIKMEFQIKYDPSGNDTSGIEITKK